MIPYPAQLILLHNYIELIICAVLFSWRFQKRKLFPLRAILSVLFLLFIPFPLGIIKQYDHSLLIRVFCNLVDIVIILPVLFFLFKESKSELLLAWCAIIAVYKIGGYLITLLYLACGVDYTVSRSFFEEPNEVRDWIIYHLIRTVFQTALSALFYSKNKVAESPAIRKNIIITSVIIVFAGTFLSIFIRNIEMTTSFEYISSLFYIVIYSIILFLRSNIFSQSKQIQEKQVLEELLRADKKKYENSRNNLEQLNGAYHDIKKQLSNVSHKLAEDEIIALERAINLYDKTIKTGSQVLDTVLYENQLHLEEKKIKISCFADGKLLEFITYSDLYSLFNNALQNAEEAVEKLSDSEKRVINISVKRQNAVILINFSNYYDEEILFYEGMPKTSKADVNKHGYGLMSIKHIAEKYGGKVSIDSRDNIFSLTIAFIYK